MIADEKPRMVAHVRANDSPPGLTFGEWLVWRCAEDVRMAAELAELREAILERLAGVTLH